jgi:hypothetical protein
LTIKKTTVTPKQAERIRKKISDIRAILAAEKKRFGDYDDSRGLRYVPPRYFIQLGDYKGGLRYLQWFARTFSDDSGFPDFLFEWTVILFKCAKTKEAVKKAFETYCANTYLFDKFFGRPIVPIDKWEHSNLAIPAFADYFNYSSSQPELTDFSEWLAKLIANEEFKNHCEKYIQILKRLKTEDDTETRGYLLRQINQLKENLSLKTTAFKL